MADALETLRRMQRQAGRRRGPGAVLRTAGAPVVAGGSVGPSAADVALWEAVADLADGVETPPSGPGQVVVRGPLDASTPLTAAERQALVSAGLVVDLEDGRSVVLGLGAGAVLSWPLGVVDAAGRPLPYLRSGGLVIPMTAADEWKYWRGGLDPDEVLAQLVAAGRVWGEEREVVK